MSPGWVGVGARGAGAEWVEEAKLLPRKEGKQEISSGLLSLETERKNDFSTAILFVIIFTHADTRYAMDLDPHEIGFTSRKRTLLVGIMAAVVALWWRRIVLCGLRNGSRREERRCFTNKRALVPAENERSTHGVASEANHGTERKTADGGREADYVNWWAVRSRLAAAHPDYDGRPRSDIGRQLLLMSRTPDRSAK
ncbi:hypothetical protein MUK42_09483 [Musa troglodytarum]|uniref:Uncharacterized protein n=1 Tax=Musa troglodytarum TaxID=320322 RepID=A0A9E7K5G9_9LILI|nr:hypothetical protein MUK42_09483 [Musa troglodytarum]